jgi:lactoylglutathione lyase
MSDLPQPDTSTKDFIVNQTMLRVRDPARSVEFYTTVLGMTLLNRFDFRKMSFSLYFLSFVALNDPPPPESDELQRAEYIFRQKATLELTHNWGTESNTDCGGYHNGNADPPGFALAIPDLATLIFSAYGRKAQRAALSKSKATKTR